MFPAAEKWTCWLVLLCACGGSDQRGAASPPSEAQAPVVAPAPKPPAAQPAASAPDSPNPCNAPGPITLELEGGVVRKTPWDLELTYVVDEDKKTGPGFLFLLHRGAHRWETRRDSGNWSTRLSWQGFCWRGGARPELRAKKLQIEIAPICKDGKLVELGGCAGALGPK